MADEVELVSWVQRLSSADLPADVAVYFAQHGNVYQRGEVARNPVAPLDAQIMLADDEEDEVALGVLANWEAPGEVISYLLTRFPDSEEARTHPQAPLKQKLALPAFKLGSYSLTLFLNAVKATESERQRLNATAERFDQQITLGEAWRQVRTDRWSGPKSR